MSKKVEKWKQEFAKKYGSQGVLEIDGESVAEQDLVLKLEQSVAPSLFSSKRLIVARRCLPTKASQELLTSAVEKIVESKNPDYFFVFCATKVDKRLASIKKIFKADINFVEFSLPHGLTLNSWLKAYTKQLGGEMDDAAAEQLAVFLGRDLSEEKKFGGKVVERKEVYNLWEAYSELSKLVSFSPNIKVEHVTELVVPKISENIFFLSDYIFKKNKPAALKSLENLFLDQAVDEKSTAIKILGLLAEQSRSLLLVTLLKKQNLTNQQMADILGWTTNRVFAVSKQAGQINLGIVSVIIKKLLSIDTMLKSSDINPKLLLNRLVAEVA